MRVDLPLSKTETALLASAQREAQSILNDAHAAICADRQLDASHQAALDLVRGVLTITQPDAPAKEEVA